MFSITPWKRPLTTALASRQVPAAYLRNDFDQLFEHLFADEGRAADPLRLDVQETAEALVIRAEVPGVEPDDIKIELSGDLLTISGEKRQQHDGAQGALTYSERRYGGFQRVLRLATPVDTEKVRAEHKHGVVTITLDKAQSTRPRRIEVRPS